MKETWSLATAIDIWAAGCVLIELYIGTPIFQGRSNNEMIKYFLDYKGPFSHRMVRKHIATYENTLRKEPFFNENYEFLLYNEVYRNSEKWCLGSCDEKHRYQAHSLHRTKEIDWTACSAAYALEW